MKYVDWIDETDRSNQITFPLEPEGSLVPEVEETIIVKKSMPSHDPDGNVIPPVESIKDFGIDPNSGIFRFSGTGLPQDIFEKIDSWRKSNPPRNFLYHRGRANNGAGLTYIVKILKFTGTPLKDRKKMTWNMELKNRGVATTI